MKRGQVIARVGHSGNSTEPHLHFQLMDAAGTARAVGLPIVFDDIELPFADGARAHPERRHRRGAVGAAFRYTPQP